MFECLCWGEGAHGGGSQSIRAETMCSRALNGEESPELGRAGGGLGFQEQVSQEHRGSLAEAEPIARYARNGSGKSEG